MIYLLDSNVWIAILRKKHPQVAVRYGTKNCADIRVCSIVVAELRYGCAKSAKPAANLAAVNALLAPVVSVPYDDATTDSFVSIRCYLESIGKVIGSYDMQIAAIARTNGFTLVTNNTGEFSRIPGLMLEDWQLP